MRFISIIASLALGLLAGCLFISNQRDPGKLVEQNPESHLAVAHENESATGFALSAREIVASIDDFDPSLFGESEQAQSRAAQQQISEQCRIVPLDELPELFERLADFEGEAEFGLGLKILAARWAESAPKDTSAAARKLGRGMRAQVERVIWQVWARHDLVGLREHMEELRAELGSERPLGIPFRDPMPWLMADPSQAMEARFEEDWHFFTETHSWINGGGVATPPDDARPLTEPPRRDDRLWTGQPEGPALLSEWLRRDESAALAWTRDAIAREEVPPRMRFHFIHHLNQFGYHGEAAELAKRHLTEDLQTIALERIRSLREKDEVTGEGR